MISVNSLATASLPCVTNRLNISRRDVVISASQRPVDLLSTAPKASAGAPADQPDAGNQEVKDCSRRTFMCSGAGAATAFILGSNNRALADVKLSLSNIQATPVPCPEGQTTVTGGTSFGVRCFRVSGDVTNPVKQPVYNADIFGRVYDAQGEPALDAAENLRIDTLAEVPPGLSKVNFQIAVNESQAKLGPLQLRNFKATGYLGKVNNGQGSGRLNDMDFSELEEDYVP